MIRHPVSLLLLVTLASANLDALASDAAAQSANASPSFVDERRLPGRGDAEARQKAAAEAADRAAAEMRKRFEAEAAAMRAELEAAAREHRRRLDEEAAALSKRLAAESESRLKAAGARDDTEARARAEEEARQAAAAEAQRLAEAEARARAEEEARQAAAAEAQRVAEVEARRKALDITGSTADGQRYFQRGEQFLANGDFASARLFFERASDAGIADAALRLGETYDSRALQRLGAIGLSPDADLARRWYRRASALGSTAAADRLKQLGD
jgi:hypothetical protein